MKYALALPEAAYAYSPADLARQAEGRGFESIWFPEHTHTPARTTSPIAGVVFTDFEHRYFYDPMIACAAAATATTTLKVATGVSLIIERDPIIAAKEVATLDQISGGRFLFGIGAGWNEAEMANHGTVYKTRYSLMREQVLAMRALWTQDVAEFHGKFVDFDASYSVPKPVQQPHPPIHLGGEGTKTLDRLVDYADGWIPVARSHAAPPRLGARIASLRTKLVAAGRTPESVEVSLYGCGPSREVVDAVEAMGADRVVFVLPPDEASLPAALDEFARLVR